MCQSVRKVKKRDFKRQAIKALSHGGSEKLEQQTYSSQDVWDTEPQDSVKIRARQHTTRYLADLWELFQRSRSSRLHSAVSRKLVPWKLCSLLLQAKKTRPYVSARQENIGKDLSSCYSI